MAIYDVSTNEKKANPELVAGGTLYADSPIGTILPYGGASAPSGWFLCQGQALSRTTYSELFAVIGTSFGSGDGSTTFNIPDMRESVPKGAGLTGHTVGAHLDADGLAVGEFLDDRIKSHAHDFGNAAGTSLDVYSTPQGADGQFYANHVTGGSNSGSTDNWYVHSTGSATNEVKSVGVNYIIKAKMIGVPSDFLAKVEEGEKYSTTELKTNKTWIDNNGVAHPIYRKRFDNLNFIPTAGNWITLSDLSIPNIDRAITCGFAQTSTSYIYPAFVQAVTNTIRVYFFTAIYTYNSILVEYTKTTD